eukprot:1190470-Prorocentrum_minimum.AAC.4
MHGLNEYPRAIARERLRLQIQIHSFLRIPIPFYCMAIKNQPPNLRYQSSETDDIFDILSTICEEDTTYKLISPYNKADFPPYFRTSVGVPRLGRPGSSPPGGTPPL